MNASAPDPADLAHWHSLRALIRRGLLGWAGASLLITLAGMLAMRAAGAGAWPGWLPSGAVIAGLGPLLAFFAMLVWLGRACNRLDRRRQAGG